MTRSSRLEVFLVKGVLKTCSKFTGEHPYRNFIEITLRHEFSLVNLLHIFSTPFSKNSSGCLLLDDQNLQLLAIPVTLNLAKQIFFPFLSILAHLLHICYTFGTHLLHCCHRTSYKKLYCFPFAIQNLFHEATMTFTTHARENEFCLVLFQYYKFYTA